VFQAPAVRSQVERQHQENPPKKFVSSQMFPVTHQFAKSLCTQSARKWIARLLALIGIVAGGCGTTTQRIGTEQLLVSDAVDQAIETLDFSSISGKTVYLDTQFVAPIKGSGIVNSHYIISSLRQQLAAANCFIQENRDTAEVIVEPRVGALGTNGHEVTYGIPQTNNLSTAAALVSSAPVMPAIPEISLGRSDEQSGIAKISVFAYDRETRLPIWQSGIAKAESTSKNTWLLGAGPFQRGSIYDGVRFAGKDLNQNEHRSSGPKIDYASEYVFPKPDDSNNESRVADLPDDKSKTGGGNSKR